MRIASPLRVAIFLVCVFSGCWSVFSQNSASPARYETKPSVVEGGSGKFFQGREIAHVMSHQGADWLERPEREQEEETAKLVRALNLKQGDQVADVGAGTGFISRQLGSAVGPTGAVYATEVQPEMLAILRTNLVRHGITNVHPVLGGAKESRLPAGKLDLALLVDVYHELEFPYELIASVVQSLKPGGRLVLVEYRAEDPKVPIKAAHKMSIAQVTREMALHPLEGPTVLNDLPRQHILIFKRKAK
jgi:ubiquinone/menaquinone biosynthesis C-methylase UbiE